jgi:GNAT superfamily N-acetyltransferase
MLTLFFIEGSAFLDKYEKWLGELEKDNIPQIVYHTVHPEEPYIRLDKLAIVSDYRGNKLSNLIMKEAIAWARMHPAELLYSQDPLERHIHRRAGRPLQKEWQGLIVVYVSSDMVAFWEKFQFVVDDGVANEHEGVKYVGMWRRIKLPDPESLKQSDWLKA